MDWHDRRRRRLGGANAGMPDRRGVATGMHTRAGWQLEGIMAGCYGHGDFAGPEAVLSFEEGGGGERKGAPWSILNPTFDYVKPELVDVLITNEYVISLPLT